MDITIRTGTPADAASAPRQLDTARLRLVAPTADDADEVFARYASDPEVTRYLGWPRHQSIADTRGFLAFSGAEWDRWPAGPYLIRARVARVLALCHAEHRASQRVLEKCGFTREAGWSGNTTFPNLSSEQSRDAFRYELVPTASSTLV